MNEIAATYESLLISAATREALEIIGCMDRQRAEIHAGVAELLKAVAKDARVDYDSLGGPQWPNAMAAALDLAKKIEGTSGE